jgi:mono/diheme cytochrome c family protein
MRRCQGFLHDPASGMTRETMRRGRLVWIVGVVAALEAGWLLAPAIRRLVLSVEDTPAARGHRLAANLGCFACHGPGGGGGMKNPGSKEGEVPAFTEQTQMMYVKGAEELRQYILDGGPKRQLDDADYRAQIAAAALRMPAYRGAVSAGDVEDLVAYLRAVSGQVLPENGADATRGGELAATFGCFGCHGPLGAGGVPNPRSFKGYVPGFWDGDYDELVRSDEELHRWIAEGAIPRISEHPIGGWFFRRQAIKMPAYGKFVAPEDVSALEAYVKWLRAGAWRSQLQ